MDYENCDWLREDEQKDYTDRFWTAEIIHDKEGYKVINTTEDNNGLPLR